MKGVDGLCWVSLRTNQASQRISRQVYRRRHACLARHEINTLWADKYITNIPHRSAKNWQLKADSTLTTRDINFTSTTTRGIYLQCRSMKRFRWIMLGFASHKPSLPKNKQASNVVGVTLAWRVMKSTPYDQTDISPTYPTARLKTDSWRLKAEGWPQKKPLINEVALVESIFYL